MPDVKKQPRVVIFTTPTCGHCGKAKRFMKENSIKFREIDISRDPDAAKDAARLSGGTAVPVILVGGRTLVGFDRSKLEGLLGLKKRPEMPPEASEGPGDEESS